MFLIGDECKSFNFEIVTKNLQQNQVYYTEILGMDACNSSIGTLFRFPISIILPESFNREAAYSYEFKSTPTVPNRFFLSSPHNCNVIEVSLMPETIVTGFYSLTVAYLEDKVDARHTKKTMRIKLDKPMCKHTFQIKSEKVIEVSLTPYPTDVVSPITMNAQISFYGVSIQDQIVMDHNLGSLPVTFTNSIYRELEISPQITFKTVRTPLNPISTKFYNYGENDVNMTGEVYQYLKLNYEFTIHRGTFFSVQIPGSYRYSNTSGISLQVFDRNKKYIDDGVNGCYYISPGKYTLHLQIKDTNLEILKDLQKLPVCLDCALTNPISIFALNKRTMSKFANDSEKYGKRTIGRGSEETVFFAGIEKKGQWIENWCAPAGSYLMGSIQLANTDEGTPFFENAVKYYLSNDYSHSNSISDNSDKIINGANISLEDNLKREEYRYLRELDGEQWTNLFCELQAKYPNCKELMMINLEFLYNKKELSTDDLQCFSGLSMKIMQQLEVESEENSKRSSVLKMRAYVCVDYMLTEKNSFIPTICMPKRIFNNLDNENDYLISFADADDAFIQYKAEESKSTPEENWLLECKHAALHNHWGRMLGFLIDWKAFFHKEQKKSMNEQDITIAQIFEHHGWLKLAGMFRSIEMVENRELLRVFQGNIISK